MVIIKPNQPDMILTCLEKLETVPSAFDFVNGAEVEACDLERETHFNNWNIFNKEIFSKTDENHIPFYTNNVLDGSS